MLRPRLLYLPLAGALGVLAGAIPTLAAGDSPPNSASFTAIDFAWEANGAPGTQAAIAPGGSVSFSYPSGMSSHNAHFDGSQPSSCTQTAGTDSGSVPPLPHTPTGPGWSGNCTFNDPGTYSFHCDLHPFMTGTVVVGNPGGTTSTQTTSTGGPPPTTSTSTTTPGSGGSPLAGPAGKAVVISSHQRGKLVRGSITLSAAGAGGRLEVILFASASSLGRHRHHGRVLVGRLVRRGLHAGTVRFGVALDAAARRALHAHKRLKLTVSVAVTSPRGIRATATRTVLLRP